MERRLAIVLAALLGGFSVLWVVHVRVMEIGQAVALLR